MRCAPFSIRNWNKRGREVHLFLIIIKIDSIVLPICISFELLNVTGLNLHHVSWEFQLTSASNKLHQLLFWLLGISITPLSLHFSLSISVSRAWVDKGTGCMLDRSPIFPTLLLVLNNFVHMFKGLINASVTRTYMDIWFFGIILQGYSVILLH